ncbi:MAG: hypothetical protein WAW52_10245 [Methanothrix sp.]
MQLFRQQPLRHPPLLAQIHPDIHPWLDPLEVGIHDADELQRPQDVALLGIDLVGAAQIVESPQ